MGNLEDPLQRETTPKKAFQVIFHVWRSRLSSLTMGVLFSLIALLFGLALMSFAGGRIALTSLGVVMISSIFLKILGGGRLLMRYVERLYTHNAMFKALSDLRVWFFKRLSHGAAAGLGFRHSGDVLSRLVSDIETLDGLYLRLIVPFIGACFTFLVLVFTIGYFNIFLSLVIGVFYILAGFVCPILCAFITRKKGKIFIANLAQLRINVLDFIYGLREIRAFGAEQRIQAVVQQNEQQLFNVQESQTKAITLMGMIAFLCSQMAILCILLAAFDIVFDGMSPFHVVFCLFLTIVAFEVVIPLTKAGGMGGQIVNAAVRIVGVNDGYISSESEQNQLPDMSPNLDIINTDIQFKDVSFRWNNEGKWVYHRLNFSITQGQHIAIMGPSGAGKSTLAALLLKVIVPQEGKIILGGQNMAHLNDHVVRKQISWLSQNTHLFDDTIRENLLLGNPQATEDDMWRALSQASVADVVKSMPDGLDTWLGEGGIKVSGGQGRRLALARTLLSNAPILLLDEPTTGLDADTEREFFQILNRISSNKTVILIVHRLTGVEQLDKVWRLSDSQLFSE